MLRTAFRTVGSVAPGVAARWAETIFCRPPRNTPRPAEEAFLARKFGADYVAYCGRVNRFVPDLRGLSQTIRGFEFDWKRVVRKDYGTTFTWMSTALVLIALKHAIVDTPRRRSPPRPL